MKSIDAINIELSEALDNYMDAKAKLKSLDQVQKEFNRLLDSKNQMIEQLEKEEKDVEKLMSFSFSNIVSTVLNNKQEKLSKEEEEVIQAKRNLDEVTYEYEEVKERLDSLLTLKASLPKLKRIYQGLIDEKRDYIKSNNPKAWLEVSSNDSKIEDLNYEQKEINEALSAGLKAQSKIDETLKTLGSAKSWGTYDMLGGGLMSSMVKHQKIDEAKMNIQSLSLSLKTFEKELNDTNIKESFDIRFDSGTKFVDMFFDNIFTDMSVQNKIKDSIADVQSLRTEISTVINRLEQNKRNNTDAIIAFENKNAELIKNI